MIVIFDTNVWISDLVLTSNVGSAVRFFLREQNARIGLPEVVKLEAEYHLRTKINDHIEEIRSSHRQLLSVFGRLKEVVLPDNQEVEGLIAKLFHTLGVPIEEIPFELDSARASLVRAVTKLPPSDRSQQFKDGVLWEDCLKILSRDSIFLVTADKAFYKSKDLGLGLADELRRDLDGRLNELRIFSSLADLLSEIDTGVRIEVEELIEAYLAVQGQRIEAMATKHGFALHGDPSVDMDVFVTENPELLFATFTICFPCSDASGESRRDVQIYAQGEGSYSAAERRFVEFASRGERLSYNSDDGTERKVENIVLVVGNAVIGHRTVEHSVRHKL